MITVKILDLVNSTETLQKLAKQNFKAKLAWTLARLLKSAEGEIQGYNEARLNLIKKYGEKDESGELITDEKGNCKILPESLTNFNTELNELLESEVEINSNKINFALLEDINFTPTEMSLLEPFIEFDE